MYQLIVGEISALSEASLPAEIIAYAPVGPRRASWLAGRSLLLRIASASGVADIVQGKNGKPAFRDSRLPRFNLSHSGDNIALLVSNEGEVGCDIEVIRSRKNWRGLAESIFSIDEQHHIDRQPADRQLAAFWQVWTRKEAVLKQAAGSVLQLAGPDELPPSTLFVTQWKLRDVWLAICTPTPCTLAIEDILFISDRPPQMPPA